MSEAAGAEKAPSALDRAEGCIAAFLDAARMCAKAARVEKQIAVREPGQRKRSKRVPTDQFVIDLFEGGRIVCASKSEADLLAATLSKAVQEVLRPICKELVSKVRNDMHRKGSISESKDVIGQLRAARTLQGFGYRAVDSTSGYAVISNQTGPAMLTGTDEAMTTMQTKLNVCVRKIIAPICECLKNECLAALDQSLAEAWAK